jgi:BirA family biotin operon repressor/biotin-[acetyl-CoA-carboxylase] ligase
VQLFEEIIYLETTSSTNRYAKQMASQSNAIIVADEQTEGRGRLGRVWDSRSGEGIYMTFKLHPDMMPSEAVHVTQIAALACVRAFDRLFDIRFLIKWPNDIVYAGKKVAGILTEMSTEIDRISLLAIGIGINVSQKNFPEELSKIATSIEIISGHSGVGRVQIIETIAEIFSELYETFTKVRNLSFVVEEINAYSSVVGKEIFVIEKELRVSCRAVCIDEAGQLIVEDEKGNRRALFYGEVSVRGKDSYTD